MTRPGSIALVCALFASAHCGVASAPDGQDRFFDSDGVRLRYQASGQGPPVVLIHGFGETLERWRTAGVTQALTPHFRVIVLDVRGHGQSGRPHEPMAVLIGANDRFLPDVRRLSNALAGVNVVVIPNASHGTALDDPAFAKGLLAFLHKRKGIEQ